MNEDLLDRTRMPNLFIVGAAKAGTTALHSLLTKHPDVCMSAVKEPHYFADVRPDPNMRHLVRRTTSLDDYLKLFSRPTATFVGEASPSYLFDATSAQRISAANPAAKIVVMLRDPIERAFSHYLMDVREGRQPRSFEDALAFDRTFRDRRWGTACHLYEDLGHYADQIARYLDVFDKNQILVLESRQFATDRESVADALGTFLGLPAAPFLQELDESERNQFARPKSRTAAAIISNTFARRTAQRIVPRRTRHTVRDRMLLARDQRPVMQDPVRRDLEERFSEQVHRARAITGLALPSLTDQWLTDS
ncbi:sulfotransferase [Nocardioides maradonensis]